MMHINSLNDHQLNGAAALACGYKFKEDRKFMVGPSGLLMLSAHPWDYCGSYFFGGPLIEEMLPDGLILRVHTSGQGWTASVNYPAKFHHDATALKAAVRCYVALKLGISFDFPEELR